MTAQQKLKYKSSEFIEKYIKLNNTLPFSFGGREYLRPVYDSGGLTELFKTARQCYKSTFLSNKMITRGITIPDLYMLYEAPREGQSKTFSKQKIRNILTASKENLKSFLTLNSKGGINGVSVLLYECFRSGSSLTLSTTFGGADRDRGASMNDLYVDEVQDQLESDINIIAESLSASVRPAYKAWCGTPKSLSNYIEILWERSKQIYWFMLCTGCRTWQVPGHPDEGIELHKIITPDGLVCQKCGKKLNVLNGVWSATNKNGKYNGWHISQLMRCVPGMIGAVKWVTPEGELGVYDKFKRLTSAGFYNEVLGFSYDSAEKPLSIQDMKGICLSDLKKQEIYNPTTFIQPVVMGIDWANNVKNYTVLSISYMYNDKPTLVYMRKFSGAEADPEITAQIIKEKYDLYCCDSAYVDSGFFFHYKHALEKEFGINGVYDNFNFMLYQRDDKHMIKRMMKHRKEKFFKISRTDAMKLFISHIKSKGISIYNWEQFNEGEEQFAKDYLTVAYETRITKDKHPQLFFPTSGENQSPTDAFHSHLYSWLGLLIKIGKFKPYLDYEKHDEYR